MDVDACKQSCLERLDQLGGIYPVRLHELLVLGGRHIGCMHHDAVYANVRQCVIGGESAESRLVDSVVVTVRVVFLQKVKELLSRGVLRVSLHHSYFGGYSHPP